MWDDFLAQAREACRAYVAETLPHQLVRSFPRVAASLSCDPDEYSDAAHVRARLRMRLAMEAVESLLASELGMDKARQEQVRAWRSKKRKTGDALLLEQVTEDERALCDSVNIQSYYALYRRSPRR